jgi:SH3-like domain-containing protein
VGQVPHLLIFLLALSACNSTTPKQSSVGTAFAGPHSLNLRKDLGPKSPTIATIAHGEAVEVVETRRRFVKVRTSQGVEGWTDENLLMTEKQMEGLRWLANDSKRFPSQGVATVYDTLNLHVDPTRTSPSFSQITEGQTVDVIGHRVTNHKAVPAYIATPARETPISKKKSSKEKKASASELPPPKPAPLPPHWLELSRPRATDLISTAKPLDVSSGAAAAGDDWSLVRLKDGRVGWVLARMLSMALPDDVAQYAEGKRITAFLSLGEVKDKDGVIKHNWLWTTQGPGLRAYEFDSFRVFVWSQTRHRYETALIERNVKGFYPIEPGPQEGPDRRGFTLVLEEKDGQRNRRTYGFSGYHVRLISKEPYEPPPDLLDFRAPETTEVAQAGWRDKVTGWWHKVTGK